MTFQASDVAQQSAGLEQEIQSQLDQFRRALKEVNLMLEQSQVELSKLSQRNANITSHLQQIQNQFDNLPRADIRMAYASAIEAQQRLWVMRGQIEKWQSDQNNFQKTIEILERLQGFSTDNVGRDGKSSGTANLLDMLIAAQEAERKRLSQQMHDGPAQTISNFIIQSDIAMHLFETDPAKAKDELNNLKTAALGAFQKVRNFIFELRPMMLDDLGVGATLKRYVESFKEQHGVEVNLDIAKGSDRRLVPTEEVVIFRALQDLMVNAARHNLNQPSKIQIMVQLVIDNNLVKVMVMDNGRGYDEDSLKKIMAGKDESIGIKLIKERVEMLGGTVDIDTSPGKGCKVVLQMPCSELKSDMY